MIKPLAAKLIKCHICCIFLKPFVFHSVEIGGKDNKCLQFALNTFYKDVDDLKHATVLWNTINRSNTTTMRCNDNVFVFNIMLGYNTSFYDVNTKYWYWDEVHFQAGTCYIEFSEHNYDYIKHLRPYAVSLDTINNKE